MISSTLMTSKASICSWFQNLNLQSCFWVPGHLLTAVLYSYGPLDFKGPKWINSSSSPIRLPLQVVLHGVPMRCPGHETGNHPLWTSLLMVNQLPRVLYPHHLWFHPPPPWESSPSASLPVAASLSHSGSPPAHKEMIFLRDWSDHTTLCLKSKYAFTVLTGQSQNTQCSERFFMIWLPVKNLPILSFTQNHLFLVPSRFACPSS